MERTRHRIRCAGVVQGVGFRPAVWRLASALDLGGWVRNDGVGVTVEVEGEAGEVARFAERLRESRPPLARVEHLEREEVPPRSGRGFSILDSEDTGEGGSPIPPDSALCAACAAEVADPDDRRHRYPFTTCTDCGPRFTVALGLPYDRERTSLRAFPLCAECAAEYADPASRRFHAESICCPSCGPSLRLATSDGRALAEGSDAASGAREALALGRIVAVKGLGGFQLACRADREEAVALLRERKHRPHKPLAVMARDLVTARRLVRLTPDDEALLTGPRSPILLAGARTDSPVAPGVAPGLDELGVMLPTTPLHLELFRDAAPYDVLIMTSGNASEEPICRTDDEGLERLGAIADLFLLHGREVVRRVDDSVVRNAGGVHLVVRRSRGYVPGALPLPEPCPEPVLALGGYLQTTACVASGTEALPSQHVGDLDTESARAFLREVAEGLEAFVDRRGRVLVADLHPDYPSGWLAEDRAKERGARVLRVQHHLHQQVAQLLFHVVLVGVFDRFEELVRFVEQAREQAVVGLLPVPRTAAGTSQAGDNVDKSIELS